MVTSSEVFYIALTYKVTFFIVGFIIFTVFVYHTVKIFCNYISLFLHDMVVMYFLFFLKLNFVILSFFYWSLGFFMTIITFVLYREWPDDKVPF